MALFNAISSMLERRNALPIILIIFSIPVLIVTFWVGSYTDYSPIATYPAIVFCIGMFIVLAIVGVLYLVFGRRYIVDVLFIPKSGNEYEWKDRLLDICNNANVHLEIERSDLGRELNLMEGDINSLQSRGKIIPSELEKRYTRIKELVNSGTSRDNILFYVRIWAGKKAIDRYAHKHVKEQVMRVLENTDYIYISPV